MSDLITRKIDVQTFSDPMGRTPADDPWAAFREVERIELNLEFHFQHSLGKVSRFFLELENHRLMGTRCPQCGKVWMPPRALCGDDMTITEWVALPNHGTLNAASLSAYTLTSGGGSAELVLGYVQIEGADTAILQQIKNYDAASDLVPGRAMRVAWANQAVAHPMQSFWFEPA